MPSFTKVANGNITPARFVKLDVTADGRVLQAGAGEQIYGISQAGTRNTPYSTLDDGFAAIAGENLKIFGPPDKEIMLELGGTVVRGDRLKSDASGRGLATVIALDEVGAIAAASGVLGELIPVQCIPPAKL